MDGEELSEVVGGRVESPVHHEVVRSAQDVEVVLCPQEEGAAEVDGVLGVPEKKVDSAPGAEVGRGDDEVLQGRRVDRVVVQLLSDTEDGIFEGLVGTPEFGSVLVVYLER